MQEKDPNQQLIQKTKQGIVMSILNAVKYEKKRSQSTRARSRKQITNELNQQNPLLLNQTLDSAQIRDENQGLLHNNQNASRKIIASSKKTRKYENNFCGLDNIPVNVINSTLNKQNNKQVDLQRYFSQQSTTNNNNNNNNNNNYQDLPLPFFPIPCENEGIYNLNSYNEQMSNIHQNQIPSALETPKFNLNPYRNTALIKSNNQDDLDINFEHDNNHLILEFDVSNPHEHSPQQINQKDSNINSRRNEYFSFGKSRSSLSQIPSKLQNEGIFHEKNQDQDDDQLFENEDFQNIIINHPNFRHKNNKFAQKCPSSFLLSEISQNLNNINDQFLNTQNNKFMNTINFSKQNKSVIPFKVKSIPKGSNINVLKMQAAANQSKLNSNAYTFYNYLDKENCSFSLPKSDSTQFRNSKIPIQASHSIQLPLQQTQKIQKQISPTLCQNQQQKTTGSLYMRPLFQQKQTKAHSVHLKQLQTLNDSLNGNTQKQTSNKMIQNYSFDSIQQTLIQPTNNNNHKRSQQEHKINNSTGGGAMLNLANHNNSFEIGRFADQFIQKENSLKIPSKQIFPNSNINKNQRQLSAKKPIKQESSQSFHQRMKTIM